MTDGRGFRSRLGSASVSSSDFSIEGGGPAKTIPVSDASYAISSLATATGPATFGYVPEVGLGRRTRKAWSTPPMWKATPPLPGTR